MIKTIWTNNRLRNFNYLLVCDETGEALAIDPLDHKQCLSVAAHNNWTITHILNTHEHSDHIGGNRFVAAATGAKILAHKNAYNSIPDMDQGLQAGDVIKVGKTIEVEIIDTPGHTLTHVCAIMHGTESALFSGDTLFNAGVGNCHNGGHPEILFDTFSEQICKLDANMAVYAGHDYLANNLRFTLDREPDNHAAKILLEVAEKTDPEEPYVTTIAEEFRINAFFRLQETTVIEKLREKFDDLPTIPDPKTVFLKLRELRNHW